MIITWWRGRRARRRRRELQDIGRVIRALGAHGSAGAGALAIAGETSLSLYRVCLALMCLERDGVIVSRLDAGPRPRRVYYYLTQERKI